MGDLGRARRPRPGAGRPRAARGPHVASAAAPPSGASSASGDAPPVSSVASPSSVEPEEHAAHQHLLGLAAAEEDLLGGVGDRSPHAAGCSIPVQRQHPPVAASPRLVERVREQRQRTGLASDVGQHRVDQTGLEPEPFRLGRLLDRPAQLVGAHGPSRCWCSRDRGGEARMLGAAAVEVRSQRDRRLPTSVQAAIEEPSSLQLVRAERERLLELIDDEKMRACSFRFATSNALHGSGPGVRRAVLDTSATSPRLAAARTPARTRDDFPYPEAPTMAMNRLAARRASTSSRTSSRPKNRSASSGSNASRPRYGHSAGDGTACNGGADSAYTFSG